MSKLASFPFYIQDWFGSESVAEMDYRQTVLYLNLLIRCWERGDLPEGEQALRKLANFDSADFDAAWPVVKQCFTLVDGRYRNAKVDEKRPTVVASKESRSERAAKAAAGRWNAPSNAPSIPPSNAQAMPEAMPDASDKQCLCDAIPSTSTSSIALSKGRSIKEASGGGVCRKEDLDQIAHWCAELRGVDALPDAGLCMRVWKAGNGNLEAISQALAAAAAAGTGKRAKSFGLCINIVEDFLRDKA